MNHSPRTKAIELVAGFAPFVKIDEFTGYPKFELQKSCALILVEEILKVKPMIEGLPESETKIMMDAYPKFWEHVKNEIINVSQPLCRLRSLQNDYLNYRLPDDSFEKYLLDTKGSYKHITQFCGFLTIAETRRNIRQIQDRLK